MKKSFFSWLVASVLALSAFTASASADRGRHPDPDAGRFGLGVILGDPNGVVGKYMVDDMLAFDFAAGFGVWGGGHFNVHADILFQFDIHSWPVGTFDFYFGVGPEISTFFRNSKGWDRDGLYLGARFPVGLSFFFLRPDLDVFLELAPGFVFGEDHAWYSMDAAVGVRFWF